VRRNEIFILLHARILSFTYKSGPFANRRAVVRPLQSPGYTGLTNSWADRCMDCSLLAESFCGVMAR